MVGKNMVERKKVIRHVRDLEVYQIDGDYESILSMLNVMEKNADKFCY